MFQPFGNYISYILLFAALFAFPFAVSAQDFRQQDVVAVDRQIRFRHGKISSVVSNRIQRGTTHIYRVKAREGQRMQVVLITGRRTSFIVSARSAGILEGTDGVRQAVFELPKTGEILNSNWHGCQC